MPRRRLRDWPISVYRYWARPREPLPESLWTTAHAMRDAWNALCAGRARVADEARALSVCLCGDDHRGLIRARWEAWNSESRICLARPGLNWETGPAVLDRFVAACVAASRRQRGWPVSHRGLDRIAIPHRFTGGGIPVAKLASPRARRVRLVFPPPGAYEDQTRTNRRRRLSPPHRDGPHPDGEYNRFAVGEDDEAILFRFMVHRPLPSLALGAKVKQVTWLGQRHVVRGWQWALAITVEEPPRTMPERATRCAGLDVGWRVMRPSGEPREDYLRIGVLVDGATGQAIELRLPLYAPTAHTRRHHLRADWRDLAVMDEAMSALLDNVRATLLPTPHLSQMKQGGLIRLLRELAASGENPATRTILEAWRVENDRLRAMRMELWDRLIGRRRWLYENLAAWIASTWTHVAWEGDLGLKQMAEEAEKAPAIDASMRYRQIASLHGFRRVQKQAAMKHGTMLIDKPAARTTLTCWLCGDILPGQDGSLWLECARGHRWDQDVCAGHNLLSQIDGGREQEGALRNAMNGKTPESLVIPDRLRAVAVPVHAG